VNDNPLPWRECSPMRARVFQREALSKVRRENDEVSNCEQHFGDSLYRFAWFEQIS
jgi:hypothetical protein